MANGSLPVKDEKIDIINPSDETVIGTLNVGSQQDIDKAVKAAKDCVFKLC